MLLLFLVCFAGALFPPISADIYVLVVCATSEPGRVPLLIAIATVAQVAGKIVIYAAGRGVPGTHSPVALTRLRGVLRRRRPGTVLVLTSAFAGIPPFYPISFLAGAVHIALVRFTLAALAGRGLRLAVLGGLPHLLRLLQ